MRFAKGHILTSSRSKEAAAGLEPVVKIISIVKSWWKLLKKNATLQIYLYNLFGSDDNSTAYCTNGTVKKILFCMRCLFQSNNLGCLKQKVFLKKTWDQIFTSAFMTKRPFLLILWRKGLVQMFAVFWLVFTKLWSYKAIFESNTTPTNAQHISPLIFLAYFC